MQTTTNERRLLIRNVKPGGYVLDEEGVWQKVTGVHVGDDWTTLTYADGSEEEGPNGERVQVADDVTGTPTMPVWRSRQVPESEACSECGGHPELCDCGG